MSIYPAHIASPDSSDIADDSKGMISPIIIAAVWPLSGEISCFVWYTLSSGWFWGDVITHKYTNTKTIRTIGTLSVVFQVSVSGVQWPRIVDQLHVCLKGNCMFRFMIRMCNFSGCFLLLLFYFLSSTGNVRKTRTNKLNEFLNHKRIFKPSGKFYLTVYNYTIFLLPRLGYNFFFFFHLDLITL